MSVLYLCVKTLMDINLVISCLSRMSPHFRSACVTKRLRRFMSSIRTCRSLWPVTTATWIGKLPS